MTDEAAIYKVLKAYGLTYARVDGVQKGYRNKIYPVQLADGRMINVTFYKREDDIVKRMERADQVSSFLYAQGMPTRQKYDARTLRVKDPYGTTYVGVYTYLPGSTIPWESYTMTHIKLLGKAMSDMHFKLTQVPIDLPSVYDEYEAIVERMKVYFSQPGVVSALRKKIKIGVETDKLDEYMKVLSSLKKRPGQQALHMDFVRGNILFRKARSDDTEQLDGLAISGILDFEKVAYGHPIMDIARTLAFLLVDCKYKTPEKVRKYFLVSGYEKRGLRSDETDPSISHKIVELFLMYDFYKFLRHNPYESLANNEHYIRTRDILNAQNVIRYL